jgi:hypothetical protein
LDDAVRSPIGNVSGNGGRRVAIVGSDFGMTASFGINAGNIAELIIDLEGELITGG